jgi:hypothetical protein
MTTQQVANRLVELWRQGKMFEAQQELYSVDVISIEPEGNPMHITKGLEAVTAKGKHFASAIIERHGGACGDPIIAGNFFSLTAFLDVTFKERGRVQINEICVYGVKDGKIISEQFFY